jgi:hypothetical protein
MPMDYMRRRESGGDNLTSPFYLFGDIIAVGSAFTSNVSENAIALSLTDIKRFAVSDR